MKSTIYPFLILGGLLVSLAGCTTSDDYDKQKVKEMERQHEPDDDTTHYRPD